MYVCGGGEGCCCFMKARFQKNRILFQDLEWDGRKPIISVSPWREGAKVWSEVFRGGRMGGGRFPWTLVHGRTCKYCLLGEAETCSQVGPDVVCLCSQLFQIVLSVWFVAS